MTGSLWTCPGRRVHPLSSDFYLPCALDEGHDGNHASIDGLQWNDESPYSLPPLPKKKASRV